MLAPAGLPPLVLVVRPNRTGSRPEHDIAFGSCVRRESYLNSPPPSLLLHLLHCTVPDRICFAQLSTQSRCSHPTQQPRRLSRIRHHLISPRARGLREINSTLSLDNRRRGLRSLTVHVHLRFITLSQNGVTLSTANAIPTPRSRTQSQKALITAPRLPHYAPYPYSFGPSRTRGLVSARSRTHQPDVAPSSLPLSRRRRSRRQQHLSPIWFKARRTSSRSLPRTAHTHAIQPHRTYTSSWHHLRRLSCLQHKVLLPPSP